MKAAWQVAQFRLSSHPADLVVKDFVDAAIAMGARPRRLVALPEKVSRYAAARSRRRRSTRGTLVLPLMGHKFWLVEAALAYGYDVIPYCWDVWSPEIEQWRQRLSHPRVPGAIVSSHDARKLLSAALPEKRFEFVPEALSDARMQRLDGGLPWGSRGIDVLELGRRDERWHNDASPGLKERGLVHLFEAQQGEIIFPTRGEMDVALAETRVSVCFTRMRTHPESAGHVEAMTQRYLETMAAGSIPLGDCPADLEGLFGYSPILPVDSVDPLGQVIHLIEDPDFSERLRLQNYEAMVRIGTWSSRATELVSAVERITDHLNVTRS